MFEFSCYQTAPTILFGRSGNVLAKIPEGEEGLIFYDLEDAPLNFGEEGRKEISDELLR